MLRLGLISDLHADLDAVTRALDLLADIGVDKVVCLGDLVEKGDDGDDVVALIERSWISCVQGNHDENAVIHSTMAPELLPKGYEERPLTSETLDFLRELPQQRMYEWEGTKVLMLHATPSNIRASQFHEAMPGTFTKKFKKDVLRSGADVVLLGHTHTPMAATYKGIKIYNPGAVCRRKPRDSHTCAVLTLPTHEYAVYDIATGDRVEDILTIAH